MSGIQQMLLGGAPAVAATYIEDVFSTYLYTGTGATNNIVNNIDLSTKGGLVWTKPRSNAYSHTLYDTARGTNKYLNTDATYAEQTSTDSLTAFNNDGFTAGADSGTWSINKSNVTYASWTFRKQAKFFDVVTYTGNGSNRTISHNLGSVPGCIMVKRTDTTGAWATYHRSLANTEYLVLNTTAAKATGATYWNSTTPTSTEFSLGTATDVNANTGTYVAYLFAHDAGGFGLSNSDNVISCGSLTADGSGNGTVNLGYEPQWVLLKASNQVDNWYILDNMRGFFSGTSVNNKALYPNLASAEANWSGVGITSTGFQIAGFTGYTLIYIAIRRGPMKTPTDATTVFKPTTFTGVDALQTAGFPVDFLFEGQNLAGTIQWYWMNRLVGPGYYLQSNATSAESAQTGGVFDSNTQVKASDDGNSYKRVYEMFRRAPGFFDVVCYTGTGSATTVSHNLGVAPELIITKRRSSTNSWLTYSATLGIDKYLTVETTDGESSASGIWGSASPTSTVFSLPASYANNSNGSTYVAYLFASVSGVSKVGTYTGNGGTVNTNGTSQTINCGFTAGSRFVLIKRTDSTGDWYVFDSARGIVAASDPYVLVNSTAAEVTTVDAVDTDNSGFVVNQTSGTNLNVTSATYIFLAIS